MPEIIDNRAADRLSRERVRTELDKNFFVEAGAGSGKTTLLVERMAAMVKGGIDIKQIAAITFTKAAAREFYQRFQKKLFDESRNEELSVEQRMRCTSALADIDLCFMDTIDAFCQTVMLEHPVETGIRFGSGVLSDSDRKTLCRDMLSAIRRGEYDSRYPGLRELYEDMANWQSDPGKAVVTGLEIFLRIRGSKLYIPDTAGLDPDAVFSDLKKKLYFAAETLASHSEYVKPGKASDAAYRQFVKGRIALDLPWRTGSNMLKAINLIKGISDLRICVTPESTGLEQAADLFEPMKDGKTYRPKPELDKSTKAFYDSARYASYVRFMERFASAAAEEMHDRGLLGFTDFLMYMRDSLRRDAADGGSLIKHISKRRRYFLIDEFQDTDPLQAEIFFLLSAEQPDPDWRRARPRPGSLFIVGDPKQSIYRFKGADIDSFLAVRSRFLGDDRVGDTLTLYRNFRSAPVLRNWFNNRFAEIFRQSGSESDSLSGVRNGVLSGVDFYHIPENDDDDMHADSLFEGVFSYYAEKKADGMTYAANIIKTIAYNDRYLIYDRKAERTRPIEYSDIMVITYGKKDVPLFAKQLTALGIPFYEEGATDFSGQRELTAMRDVFGAFTHPAQADYIYAALTSPAFGLTDDVMCGYTQAGGSLSLLESDDGDSQTAAAMRRLNEIRLNIAELSPYPAYIRAAEMLDILGLDGVDYLRREYFWYAAELLRAGEADGSVCGTKGIYSFLDGLLSSQPDRDPVLDPDKSLVHIANLHKVKGLEAPVVILLGALRSQRGYSISADRSADPMSCVILDVSKDGLSACSLPDGVPEDVRLRSEYENLQAQAETARLDYVAATRAGSALIIGEVKKYGASVPCWRLLLEGGVDALELDGSGTYSPPQPVPAADCTACIPLPRLLSGCIEPSVRRVHPSELKAPKKRVFDTDADDLPDYRDEDAEDSEDAAETGTDRSDSALIGTLVHRAVELLVLSGFSYKPEALSRAVMSEYDVPEDRGKKYANIVKNVAKKILRGGYMQRSGYPSDIMNELKSADRVLCETPFCIRDDEASSDGQDVIIDGVIDLMYRKDGQWHIVDYKTGLEDKGLEQLHAGQLEAYKKAFLQACGEDAETHIYHIDIS